MSKLKRSLKRQVSKMSGTFSILVLMGIAVYGHLGGALCGMALAAKIYRSGK